MKIISQIFGALGGVGILAGLAGYANAIWDLHLSYRRMEITDDPLIATGIFVAGLVAGGLGLLLGRNRA
ncbi:MAG: hypothetical protein KDK37_14305 [Leptospiraceae bacterium]|nr:hypothetical protein [Leptospiraceae bacterium]MCB1305455.1 hypothetical protein [Leptospiraceae bacterium]